MNRVTSDKPNVLIIDDTPANLKLLESLLTKSGYSVRPAPSGKLALMAAKIQAPDIILLDIAMPEMDGYETCTRLKKIPGIEETPIIFISANSEVGEKVKAFEVGGVDYVTKPFQIEEVLARVNTHINLRRYQIESENKSIELQTTLDRLKDTQTQLVGSEKMASLGVLSAGVAHEINNPINYINSSAKALLKLGKQMNTILAECEKLENGDVSNFKEFWADIDSDFLSEGFHELTQNISTGAERAAEIVQSLRTFSRVDRSDKTAYNVHDGIESTLHLLNHKIKEITIDRNYAEVPRVICHPGQINQVFMNLLSNAVDSINDSKEQIDNRISIATSFEDVDGKSEVTIKISDNGAGIDHEHIDKIFDPFFTTKEIGKGTGLGLSISLGIIKEHQGSLRFDDNTPTPGVTAVVSLPTC